LRNSARRARVHSIDDFTGARMSEPAEATASNTAARPDSGSGLTGLLRRLVVLEPGEGPVLLAAFAMLFCIFTSYSVLRPVRDTMGITSGVQNLPAVFWGTFIVMLLVQPVYGWLTSRFRRRVFLPWVYGFFIANLLGFYLWFNFQQDHTWIARCYFVWVSVFNLFVIATFWSLMSDVLTREQAGRMFGFIAAGMSLGGLVGPLLITYLTKPLAHVNILGFLGHTAAGADEMGTVNLLLISALLLVLSTVFMGLVNAWDEKHGTASKVQGAVAAADGGLGGAFGAFVQVARSPYLAGVALLVFLLTWITTPLYLQQQTFISNLTEARPAAAAHGGHGAPAESTVAPAAGSGQSASALVSAATPVAAAAGQSASSAASTESAPAGAPVTAAVAATAPAAAAPAAGGAHSDKGKAKAPTCAAESAGDPKLPLCQFHSKDEQTLFLAKIDFWVQTASLIGQLLIFGRLFKWLGMRVTLTAVPLLMVIGYVVFALVPAFSVVVWVYAIRRVGDYALMRPSRESLFTVVTRDEKYKAKSLIDTFVYRGGDATNGSMYDLLTKTLSVSAAGVGWFGAALSAVWLVLAYSLGRAQEERGKAAQEAAAQTQAQAATSG
jgi:ATP/ADP translocase